MSELTTAKIISYCEKTIYWTMGFMFILIPLFFNPYYVDAFNLPKVTLFRLSVLIMFAAWVIKNYFTDEFTYRTTKIDLAVIIFLGVTILSTIFSINKFHSFFGQYMYHFEGLLSVITYVLMFVIFVNTFDSEDVKSLLGFMLIGCLITFTYGILQRLNIDFVSWPVSSAKRVWSSFGNPNFFSGYLVMLVPILLGYYAVQQKTRWLLVICILVGIVGSVFCNILTYSRAGLLGLFAGVSAYLLMLGGRNLKVAIRVMIIAVVVVGIAFAALGIYMEKSDIEPIKESKNIAAGFTRTIGSIVDFKAPNVQARIGYMQAALSMFIERPIFGFGPDSFSIIWRKYMTKKLSKLTGNRLMNPGYAHNEILQVAATTGIFGVASYLLLVIGVLRTGLKIIANNTTGKFLIGGMLASIVAVLVNNQFSFHSPTTALILWFSISAIAVFAGTNEIKFKVPNGMKYIVVPVLLVCVIYSVVLASKIYIAESYFPKGLFYESKRLYDIAINNYARAVQVNPYEQTYYQNLGKIFITRAEVTRDKTQKVAMLEASVKVYRKHLGLIPQDALSWNGLGIAYMNMAEVTDQNKYYEAEVCFRQAIEYAPVFLEPYINLGTALYLTDRKQDALSIYEKAIDIDPLSPLIYFNLGNIHAQEGEIKKAISYWQDALDLDPNYQQAKINIELNERSVSKQKTKKRGGETR